VIGALDRRDQASARPAGAARRQPGHLRSEALRAGSPASPHCRRVRARAKLEQAHQIDEMVAAIDDLVNATKVIADGHARPDEGATGELAHLRAPSRSA